MDLEPRLLELENSIKATEDRIEEASSEYRKAEDLGDERRAERWWDRETQLRDKEKQLREEKASLLVQHMNKRKSISLLAPGKTLPASQGNRCSWSLESCKSIREDFCHRASEYLFLIQA